MTTLQATSSPRANSSTIVVGRAGDHRGAGLPPAEELLREPARWHVRRLRNDESETLAAHFAQLGDEARRMRFCGAAGDRFIASHARSALGGNAVVLGLFVDGVLRGVAELHLFGAGRDEAEAAFSIEPGFQGLGHGGHLFARLLKAAGERKVRRLFLTFLCENHRMRALAERHGARLTVEDGEVTAEIRRPAAELPALARQRIDRTATQFAAGIAAR